MYKVVPCSPSAGVVEWVEHTLPLIDYLAGEEGGEGKGGGRGGGRGGKGREGGGHGGPMGGEGGQGGEDGGGGKSRW